MRFPRWLNTCLYLALGLFLICDFGSRLVEWLTTGQLRLWSRFGPDHHVSFSQEPGYFVFGFVTMTVMTVITLVAIAVSSVED